VWHKIEKQGQVRTHRSGRPTATPATTRTEHEQNTNRTRLNLQENVNAKKRFGICPFQRYSSGKVPQARAKFNNRTVESPDGPKNTVRAGIAHPLAVRIVAGRMDDFLPLGAIFHPPCEKIHNPSHGNRATGKGLPNRNPQRLTEA
jgi:hypothetical protein